MNSSNSNATPEIRCLVCKDLLVPPLIIPSLHVPGGYHCDYCYIYDHWNKPCNMEENLEDYANNLLDDE